MKISKGNPFSKWIWETLWVEGLTQVPFMKPTSYTHQKKLTLHPLAGEKRKKEKKDFLLAQQQLSQWETITTQSVKGHQNSKLSFFSNELSLNIALPNFLHSSI